MFFLHRTEQKRNSRLALLGGEYLDTTWINTSVLLCGCICNWEMCSTCLVLSSVVEADDDAEAVSLRRGVTKEISELIRATYVFWEDTPQQSVSCRSVKQYTSSDYGVFASIEGSIEQDARCCLLQQESVLSMHPATCRSRGKRSFHNVLNSTPCPCRNIVYDRIRCRAGVRVGRKRHDHIQRYVLHKQLGGGTRRLFPRFGEGRLQQWNGHARQSCGTRRQHM